VAERGKAASELPFLDRPYDRIVIGFLSAALLGYVAIRILA